MDNTTISNPVLTIKISLNNVIEAHKALFESYTRLPDDNNEDALFFFQEIFDRLTEDSSMKKVIDDKYRLSEKEREEFYKTAN